MIQPQNVELYLSLGSNLGDRLEFLKQGISLISEVSDLKIQNVSSIYETEPVGYLDQAEFLNLAICVLTSIDPHNLLRMLKEIETSVGRVHRERWHEREIDIDIIFYGDWILNSKEIIIPHPRMHLRKFVLEPLNEIAPNFLHPVKQKKVYQLLAECLDNSRVNRTDQLLVPLN